MLDMASFFFEMKNYYKALAIFNSILTNNPNLI